MPFIKAQYDEAEIVINSENIVAVLDSDGYARVHTVAAMSDRVMTYHLDDTYGEFIIKLHDAGLFESV